jgi:hypothetical protein
MLMRKAILINFCVFCCFILNATSGLAREACLLIPVSLEQRVNNSAVIVEGKVLSQTSFWNASHTHIYTSNKVEVYKIFKGDVQGSEIEIITEGGTVGNERELLTSTLELVNGQAGIFFCMPNAVTDPGGRVKSNSFLVYSSLQGFISYDLTSGKAFDPFTTYARISEAKGAVVEVTKLPIRERKAADPAIGRAETPQPQAKVTLVPVITSFSPTSAPGGTGTLLTINGSNFGTLQGSGFVEFPNANDGGTSYVKPIASDYITWTNTQIVVRIPSTVVNPAGCAGTGNFRVTNSDPNTGVSPTPLTITYTWTNIDDGGVAVRPDLVNDNGSGGYTFQYYTTFAANTLATAAFQRAMTTWCPTQVNWTTGTTTTTNVAASDGINVVRFDVGAELPTGVAGRLTSYYSGCGPIGGPFTWYTTEMDVVFDDGTSWQYGPALPSATQYDFESVALHELGHGLQLNHVINTLDVMHYSISNGQTRRTLTADNITGGSNVVATSIMANACGSAPMIGAICPLPIQLISFTGKYIENEGALLHWKIANDETFEGYTIQRSPDGWHFENIGFVNNQSGKDGDFQFMDKDFADKAYYKVVMTDLGGAVQYTNTVIITQDGMSIAVNVYPNPAGGEITLETNGLFKDVVFTIHSADGRVVKQENFSKMNGVSKVKVPIGELAPGAYYYKVHTEVRDYTGKLIKQ